MSDAGDGLFDGVVELCGFSAYVGPGAVRRSLAEAGRDVKVATPADYRLALPALRRRLQVYIEEQEAEERIAQIERFLGEAEQGNLQKPVKATQLKDDETEWGKRRFGNTVAILQKARKGIGPDDD